MIPDANKWTYSHLTRQKHNMVPDANKWTYSNLTRQNKTKGWIPDANQLDLYQSPKNQTDKDTRCQYMGLLQSPKAKQNMDVRCQSIWTYSNLQRMIIGIQMPTIWTYNCILTYNKQTKALSKEDISGQ